MTNLLNTTRVTISASCIALLSACSGGGGSPDNNATNGYYIKPISQFAYQSTPKEGVSEIVTYDKQTQRVFVINTSVNNFSMLKLTSTGQLTSTNTLSSIGGSNVNSTKTQSLSSYGDAPNSIAAHNGKVAVAMEIKQTVNGEDNVQQKGKVVTFNINATNNTLTEEKVYNVGYLPDMLTYTPNGQYILVANEGEPSKNNKVDATGSISIIDTQASSTSSAVVHIGFDGYTKNSTELNNVRIFGKKDDGSGSLVDSSVAEDLEPEYIAVSVDNQKAWVSLQENNALVEINLNTKAITKFIPLGTKDFSEVGNEFDLSDKDNQTLSLSIHDSVVGMYQPDGIDTYQINGVNYIVTANEGDSRDYDGFSEEKRAKKIKNDVTNNLKNRVKDNAKLGRLKITTTEGKNSSGKYETLHAYGGRSFSIWNADTGAQVFDSGNEFIRKFKEKFANDQARLDIVEKRSDDKGTEPESVVVGKVDDQFLAFIGLERASGIMVYNVTDPANASFIDYIDGYTGTEGGGKLKDVAPEGLKFISANDSPTGKPLLLVANEISGTTTVFSITKQ